MFNKILLSCPARQRSYYTRLFYGGLVILALISSPACSTVRVSVRSERVDNAGIQSSKALYSSVSGSRERSALLAEFSKATEVILKKAKRNSAQERFQVAAGCYLKAALDARSLLTVSKELSNPEVEQALLQIHNLALARFAEIWMNDLPRQQEGNYQFSYEDETYEIALKNSDFSYDYFDHVVAVKSVKGRGLIRRERSGYGATLVGIREQNPDRKKEMRFYSKSGFHVSLSLTMGHPQTSKKSSKKRIIIPLSLQNPMLHETILVEGRRLPLAANFSTRFEMLLNGRNGTLRGMSGFFSADKRIGVSGIFISEPYDPNRIPVVFTHGLASAPIIWRNIMPELMSEPDIARRYQFMVFTYPSSLIIAESARLFRENLASMRAHFDPTGQDPLSTDMVAIGHSMGGVLTHLLVAETGENIWQQISDSPIESLGLEPDIESKIKEWAYFDPDKAVNRVIYISTPHRGAEMAHSSLPAFLSSKVRLPVKILKESSALWDKDGVKDALGLKGTKVTGMQSLEKHSPIIEGLKISPHKQGVIYHSIIGDRGHGDTPDSSDGVVEYWSSHQDGAASEIIVPTNHGAYSHRKTIDEIKRILRVHAKLK
ncbi:MAG: alpha/beta hydrolase [Verrucomicrobiota bacterium]